MRTLKRTAVFLLTLLWLAGCGLCSFAAGDQPVLWAAQTEQSAVLYLPQSGDVTECLVGSVKCTGVQSKAISELEHPIHTLILLDNSLSIPKESPGDHLQNSGQPGGQPDAGRTVYHCHHFR